MSNELSNSLQQFHAFIGKLLQDGQGNLSPEMALAIWRERMETVQAIREGWKICTLVG